MYMDMYMYMYMYMYMDIYVHVCKGVGLKHGINWSVLPKTSTNLIRYNQLLFLKVA